jgi:hypothetical protein
MKKLFIFALPGFMFTQCRRYPDASDLSNNFTVITNYDVTADFASYKTFILPPYVELISNSSGDTILDPQYGDPILASIKSHMEERGYTETPNNHQAHLGIAATVLKDVSMNTGWYPGTWWGYPGWAGCYWYYCGWYPLYPASYSPYSYSNGSLIIELVDLKNPSAPEKKLHVIWTDWNSGALGTTTGDINNALHSIDQAFLQSPYIKTP